eukprot:scaffold45574_cov14-Tisochrysis_lutea.AAC.2
MGLYRQGHTLSIPQSHASYPQMARKCVARLCKFQRVQAPGRQGQVEFRNSSTWCHRSSREVSLYYILGVLRLNSTLEEQETEFVWRILLL